jgi:hypothetical protein
MDAMEARVWRDIGNAIAKAISAWATTRLERPPARKQLRTANVKRRFHKHTPEAK